ncbi:STAS domain-containing protein [Streptomyces avermitilis]|uniref:STAS domain-containing protein n=1 Tax=Streptomyces avermitilis TaxID=33903 RepID=UPI0033B01AE6
MTTSSSPHFITTADAGSTVAVVRLAGDLDYESCHAFVRATELLLAERRETGPPLSALRLDFAQLSGIDSMGLSALLMVRRRTDAAGVGLYLDERPACLERLLELTDTLDHLTAPCVADDAGEADERRPGTG